MIQTKGWFVQAEQTTRGTVAGQCMQERAASSADPISMPSAVLAATRALYWVGAIVSWYRHGF